MNSNMEKRTNNNLQDISVQNFTLKVLFGPLFGCELHLTANDYFLIIGSGRDIRGSNTMLTAEHEHAACYTKNTLYIPCDTPSPNISLCLSQPAESEHGHGYRAEIHDPSGGYSATMAENTLFTHKHLCFALKNAGDSWSERIVNYSHPSVLPESVAVDNILKPKKVKSLRVFSLLLVITVILGALSSWHKYSDSDRHITVIDDLLAAAPAPLQLVSGREDSRIFALASSYQEMEWLRESLSKQQSDIPVIPVWLSQKQKEVIAQLKKADYPVLQLDFSTPEHPVLVLYQQIPAETEKKLMAAALRHIPFAKDIGFLIRDKTQLLNEARQELDRFHLHYRQINTGNGYGLIIRDALSDHIIAELRHFIHQFYQRWGNSVVTFSIVLDENWLQNKSYLDTSSGYLFLNPFHWYFPNKEGNFFND